MTEITFVPASSRKPPILVGIGGMSRSGKTLSAHRIGRGIADVFGTKVVGIDTEAGRMLEYGPGSQPYGFEFDYYQLGQPFTGERYLEVLVAAEDLVGPNGVIICDSMSHEHEGTGGVLEQHAMHAAELARRFNKAPDKFSSVAWSLAKEGRKKLINFIRSERKTHLILCFRAEQKTPILPDGSFGQPFIDIIGWSGWPFEMSVYWLLDREKRGVEIRHDTTASLERILKKEQLSEETGRALAEWFRGTAVQTTQPRNITTKSAEASEPPEPVKTAKQRAQEIAQEFDGAPDIDTLLKLEERLREDIARLPDIAKSRIATIFHTKREELQKSAPDDHSFHDAVDNLEPDDWKNTEGRVEDPRQSELME